MSIPTTESVVKVVTKKIRIYPEEECGYFDFINLHRRAYNLTIEKLKEKTDLKKSEVRSLVREIVRKESQDNKTKFSSVVSDEAVCNAYLTFEACIRKWKKKQKSELKFKSRKNPSQNFIVQKLSKGGAFSKILGKCHHTEDIPESAVNHMATVVYERGRWFLCCKNYVETKSSEIQADLNKTISLDQGIRTFVTAYNPLRSVKYGDGFSEEKLLPLYYKLDKLKSERSVLVNKKMDAQWWFDRMKSVNKRINKVQNRICDLIDDLHHKVCFDLVSNYDHILVPKFETQQMSSKEARKLNKRTVREMINLSFYKFKLRLKWYCVKYGKNFVETTEEYTSKTRSWDGVIDNKLGSKKIIKDGNIIVDRDINGARGIFLLALTR